MYALQAIGLTHTYPGGVTALRELDFAARPGQFVALLGPNGSGKTTLFRHFGGLLRPTAGKVLVDGRDLVQADRTWLYSTIGFIFQDPNDQLFAATVGEDVAFGPRNLGLPAEEIAARVAEALAEVGLDGQEGKPVHALSFGQKRRVALAGVLAMRPSILVLDEPTSGLDPMGSSRLLALLRRLNRQGTTVVMATHDVDVVPFCADVVYVLQEGRAVAFGPPPVVFAQAELLRRCELRPPRAAQALQLVGAELGQPLADLPLTMEEPAETNGGAAASQKEMKEEDCRWFTTGIAAAAAARAAAELAFRGQAPDRAVLRSSAGAMINVPVAGIEAAIGDGARGAEAAVVKPPYGPDDPLGGLEVRAWVGPWEGAGVLVEGGRGVGRVSRPGLPVPVGGAAINPIPRQMIADAVSDLLPAGSGARVIISVPEGEARAARTINAAAGIVGGISILGTPLPIQPLSLPSLVPAHVPGSSEATAICFMGHGSRASEANAAMYRVIDQVKRGAGYDIVEAGFMELSRPSIAEAVQSCVDRGARRILLVPYFLHMGMHMRRDLPDLMREMQARHPDVDIRMSSHIGYHAKLAEIVLERIAEAEVAPAGLGGE